MGNERPYYFTLTNEIGKNRWKDIPLAVHGFSKERHFKSAIKATPTDIAGIISHLPPNGPVLFSFDYHNTLISREQELFDHNFLTKFQELTNRLTQTLGSRAIFVINSISDRLENFDQRINLPIIFGKGFGVLDKTGKRNILSDKKMKVFEDVCRRLSNTDSGLKFVRKTDGYGYIEVSTLSDMVALGRIPITKLLEKYITPEEAELLDIYWGSHGKKIKFFPGSSKLEAGEQFIRELGYNPSLGVCIHFGDEEVDIPTENGFMANFFIAPNTASEETKNRASHIEPGGIGKFVLASLDRIHKQLLVNALNPDPFSGHPYSTFVSFPDMKTLDSDEEPHHLSIRSKEIDLEIYKKIYFDQMNRLALKLIEAFGPKIADMVILPVLRGGILAGVDLASLLFEYTGIKIPVEAVKLVFPSASDLLRVTTAQTTVEALLKKHKKPKTYLLIDDWTGAGKQIIRHKAILEIILAQLSKKSKVFTASPIDPIGVCDFGEPGDILNPYSIFDESPGIKSAEIIEGRSVTRIARVEDNHLLMDPIFDFKRRAASHPKDNILYLNKASNSMPNLGQYQIDWGLGINEAIHRSRKGHTVLVNPKTKFLMEQLGINCIEVTTNFPFGWQAISVPKKDLQLLLH